MASLTGEKDSGELAESYVGLRATLYLLSLVELVWWGLPALLATRPMLSLALGYAVEGALIWARMLGALYIGLAWVFWRAARSPQPDSSVVQAGIVVNALGLCIMLFYILVQGLGSVGMWINVGWLAIFTILLIYFYPRRSIRRMSD